MSQNQVMPVAGITVSQPTGLPPIAAGDCRLPSLSSPSTLPPFVPPSSLSNSQPHPQLPTFPLTSASQPNMVPLSSFSPIPPPPPSFSPPQLQQSSVVGTAANSISSFPSRQSLSNYSSGAPVSGASVPHPHGERFQSLNGSYGNFMGSPFPSLNGFGTPQQSGIINLAQEKDIFKFGMEEPKIELPHTVCNPEACCSPGIFRCTLKQIPQSEELLNKSRLPFGLTLHPFRDVKCLSVIQTSTIVRCRYCRTYINPYIYLIDNRHWKCNLCFRSNDLPDDFSWDPVTKSYGEPTRRPEIRNATVEFIAPSEYMLRPPQPAVYVFVIDVSHNAVESGYLYTFSEQLLLALELLPGDDRTAVAFIAVDQSIHFFQFRDKSSPKQLIVDDFDEIGGRITVLQTVLPNIGPGALTSREDPNQRDIQCLAPATDFYKRLALECTGHQVAIDLFLLGTQYSDLSTLADMAKFSSGCVYHYPSYHMNRNLLQAKRFQKQLSRYLTRKIGFEAVLRIRCTRGLALHSFYGNFFVRSTDLLAMANVNPDSAFSMQVQIEEDLNGLNSVCFQAALLYTSSKGDRRIRIHTLCLPVTKDLNTIYKSFDLRCSISLLSRFGNEFRFVYGRSLEDSREAMANAAIDAFSSFNKAVAQQGNVNAVLSPTTMMRLFPLSVLGMLKHIAFSFGRSTKLDDRAEYLLLFRTAPMEVAELEILPTLYRLNDFYESDNTPQRLRLSYESVSTSGVFLLDTGSYVYIYIGAKTPPSMLNDLFHCENFAAIDEEVIQLFNENFDVLDNPLSKKVHDFLRTLQINRSVYAPVVLIREDSPMKELFTSRLSEDRTESSYSYVEFIKHVCREIHR
uniref:Protein transport protein Sec24-like At3g07100 n=1 Tax=Syphacia muris TaxID=451379 RepID=A0A0N5AML2_9BILA